MLATQPEDLCLEIMIRVFKKEERKARHHRIHSSNPGIGQAEIGGSLGLNEQPV